MVVLVHASLLISLGYILRNLIEKVKEFEQGHRIRALLTVW